jgi:hypothetical protein
MSRRLFSVLLCMIVVIASCSKERSIELGGDPPPGPGPGTGGNPVGGTEILRIQQGIDPDITNDTVHLLSYTATKKISKIVDSLGADTMRAEYDAADRLIRITESYGDNAGFT